MNFSRRRRRLFVWFSALILAVGAVVAVVPGLIRGGSGGASPGAFQVKPYLQPGAEPDGSAPVLLWQTDDQGAEWSVEVRAEAVQPGQPAPAWIATVRPIVRRVKHDGEVEFRLGRLALAKAPKAFRLYRVALAKAPKGGFRYRVLRSGMVEFEASVPALKALGAAERFVVFGDCAAGTAGQRDIAFEAFRARPDYVIVTGDIVYTRGRVSEYLDHFFPIYNADDAAPGSGVPLLRSTMIYAAPGNHDLIEANLDRFPDALAYFYYWALPLNGPVLAPGSAGAPLLKGSAERQRAFKHAAGPAYPRMANFSFDRGPVHWTVLDANPYADWTDKALRAWLEADLASPAAREASWRLVAMHHPPFSSSKAHADDQRMRVLSPVFEKAGVAVVFAGHVHNYQRSRPLKFTLGPPPADAREGKPFGPSGRVNGHWTLDTAFDGVSHTKPDGIIYVVTGAGGAKLYNREQHDRPASWNDFTARFVSNVHSLTIVDVSSHSLTLRQVSASGVELDRIVLTR